MEKTCYRCSAPIGEDAPFCPACGAPQIRVSSQFEPPAPEPGTPLQPSGLPASMAPAARPGEIQWKTFLRTAWPIAVLTGVAACFFPRAGLLILLPLSVLLAIRLYHKRQVLPLRAGQGAKLGMAMGLISFIAFASLSVIAIISSAGVREEIVQAVNQAASRNPDPQAQQILQNLVNSPQGLATMIAMGFGFLMVIFLVFSAITGAVVASTYGTKTR